MIYLIDIYNTNYSSLSLYLVNFSISNVLALVILANNSSFSVDIRNKIKCYKHKLMSIPAKVYVDKVSSCNCDSLVSTVYTNV